MAKCTFQEGAGSPVGVNVPKFIGQLYHDTTNDEYWRSTGLTNADWVFIGGGAPFVEWLPHTEVATWNDSGGIGQVGDYTTFLANADLASISYLNLSSTAITSLTCNNCLALTNVVASYCTGPLTVLDLSGCVSLSSLICLYNSIATLDLTDSHGLSYLDCRYNLLTSLNVSGCTALTNVNAAHNLLTALDVSTCINLSTLLVPYNSLATLDVTSCPLLLILAAFNNVLTSVNIAGLTQLSDLSCGVNNLTTGAGGSVNVILTDMVANNPPPGSIDLVLQAPLAPPDAGPPDGATAKTTLLGLGWVVTTD